MDREQQEYMKWMPAMYAEYYCILKEVAMKHGYALLIHGSLKNDLDLLAYPWVPKYSSAFDLLRSFSDELGAVSSSTGIPFSSYEIKCHNRVAFTIVTGGGGYIDLSIVIPRLNQTALHQQIKLMRSGVMHA